MKNSRLKITLLMILSLLVFSSVALATPSANITYTQTNVGGGWWQYDYTFENYSTAGEYLYSVFLDFASESDEVGLALPSGWDGIVWMGANTTTYLDTFATSGNDLAAGNTLGGFSFKVDYKAGNLPYTAFFDDHSGGFSTTSGTTLYPEPVSSLLFLAGGATLLVRGYLGRKKVRS